jgi:hypothetical protein
VEDQFLGSPQNRNDLVSLRDNHQGSNMRIFILYVIVQVILWVVYHGSFSVLAKSSDIFAILTTVRSAINLNDVNSVLDRLEDYLFQGLYREFRRRYIKRLDSVYIRLLEISILVITSTIFQSL